jgi:anti-sigma B factor antagonist
MQTIIDDVAEGVVNVALSGRLDTPGVERVESELTGAILPRGATTLVDLSQVDFVGSMAIRMFMALARGLVKKNRKLVLYAPQPLVSQLFDTVSLRDIIPVEPDQAAALRVAQG